MCKKTDLSLYTPSQDPTPEPNFHQRTIRGRCRRVQAEYSPDNNHVYCRDCQYQTECRLESVSVHSVIIGVNDAEVPCSVCSRRLDRYRPLSACAECREEYLGIWALEDVDVLNLTDPSVFVYEGPTL